MPTIHVLPKHIADLIAAGEVVERPASVVKELMENAIDAGATSITVEIQNGGITLIRVTDDGCGIPREDIKNAFKSHATSKISTEHDLSCIGTLGFRGEALASIAAVSRVDVLTRTKDDEIGTVYKLEGSEEVLLDDAGCPLGTTIVVRDIFFNTPARMKFLKKDVTEGNAVAGVVDRIALSHPEISIRFVRDDRQQLATPGNGKLPSTVYSVFGKDFAAGLLETDYELNGVKVSGLVSKPTASRSNRSMQFFFLNGRLVKSKTAMAALEQAYKNAIMVGRFPACVLNITVPLDTVDVNVHPAKTEVRFANEKPVFDAIYYAVKNAISEKDAPNRVDLGRLAAQRSATGFKDETAEQLKLGKGENGLPEKVEGFWSKELPKGYKDREDRYGTSSGSSSGSKKKGAKKAPDIPFDEPAAPAGPKPAEETTAESAATAGPVPYIPRNRKDKFRSADPGSDTAGRSAKEAESPVKNETEAPAASEIKAPVTEPYDTVRPQKVNEPAPTPYAEQTEIPDFRIIGESFKTYILVETEDKIIIVDKHAAHERILFDQLAAEQGKTDTQILLEPVTITCSKEEYNALLENRETLASAGFDIDDFGVGTIVLREVPVMLIKENLAAILQEMAGYLLDSHAPTPEKLGWIYANTACRAAIKAGDNTPPYEQKKLVEYLLAHRDIRYCPHGRPITIEMTRTELEKQFGRIQWHMN